MTEPFAGATPDPAAAGLYEYIERLKAAEKLLSDLVSSGPAGTEADRTAANTNTVAAASRTRWPRWRRRTN